MREKLFLLIAFFLGTWATVYTDIFNVFILLSLGINVFMNPKMFVVNLKKEKSYFLLPVVFLLYMGVHTLIYPANGYKAAYGIFESLSLYFILLPLYVLSVKDILDTKLLKRGFFMFCTGTFLFNFFSIFALTGTSLFTSPHETLLCLYESRFGANKEIFGGHIFIEPQGLYLAVAAIISLFFMIGHKKRTYQIIYLIFFIAFVWFLSLTVTKGAILAFLVGLVVISIYSLKRLSIPRKCLYIIGIAFILFMIVASTPVFHSRINQAQNELKLVEEGDLTGSSIAPRLALLKLDLEHFDEYAIWGFGVYTHSIIKEWYVQSKYGLADLNDTHNSFFQYWLIGGIVGISFIISIFVLPIYRMIKVRRYSYLIMSVVIIFFVANNTCVLLILNDSKSLIMFFLSMFYFYGDNFVELECNS